MFTTLKYRTGHRRFFATALMLLLAAACGLPAARAGVVDAPGGNLEVALVTYGPGETYWERFGHDAIEIRDRASGEAVNFNYGVFDFDERGFLLNFARGRMHYLMDAAPTAQDEPFYAQAGRSISRQTLAFTPTQAAALRDFLLWNLRPENARYNYDYYADNCTTRVRDALDHALGGVIKAQLADRAGGLTFRQQTSRLMSAQPWLMLILDLGLGPYADQPLNAWEESFLPMVLQRELRSVTVADENGHQQPLVSTTQTLSPNRLLTPPPTPPDLRLPLALVGVAFATWLLLTRRFWPSGFALLGVLYLLTAGIVGTVLLALWTLTAHHSAWGNANLFLFNPMAWLLLPALWRARQEMQPSRFANGVLALQLAAVLVAVVLHLLPGATQQNQPWILFALPCWLALAWSLRRGSLNFGRRGAAI